MNIPASPSLRNGAAHTGLSLPTLITVETTATGILTGQSDPDASLTKGLFLDDSKF